MEEVWAEAAGHGTGLESGLEHGSTERKDTLYNVSRLLFLKLKKLPQILSNAFLWLQHSKLESYFFTLIIVCMPIARGTSQINATS